MQTSSLKSLLWGLLFCSIISTLLFETMPNIKYNHDDRKYLWIRDQVFNDVPKTLDTVFIGTSHTWSAVNTATINATYPAQKSYNFGVNWFGMDTKTIIVRDLLKHKQVKNLVLEIASEEDFNTHEYFRFMAPFKDALQLATEEWGQVSWHQIITLDAQFKKTVEHCLEVLAPFVVKGWYFAALELVARPQKPDNEGENDGWESNYPAYPFKDPKVVIETHDDSNKNIKLNRNLIAIAELCRQHGVKLYFLFVPIRNEALPAPSYLTALRSWGEPIVLDPMTYYPAPFWCNPQHLNVRGAEAFTGQLLRHRELFSDDGPPFSPALTSPSQGNRP